jgi:carbon-monoxide dehydrogenase small subunit
VRIAVPRAAVWAAVQDPALIASCVPGVSLGKVGDGDIEGSLQASLGPISARFSGTAHVDYAAERFGGTITGEGRDGGTGTRLSVQAEFSVEADGADRSVIVLRVRYALHGALAQFGRGPVVRAFAAELAEMVGQRLQARLRGEAVADAAMPLSGGNLVLRAIWRWLRGLISSRDER